MSYDRITKKMYTEETVRKFSVEGDYLSTNCARVSVKKSGQVRHPISLTISSEWVWDAKSLRELAEMSNFLADAIDEGELD